MRGWWALAIVVVAAWQALASEAPPQLQALMEAFHAHRRVAMGYLRTHNVDLGVLELERLWERWQHERRGILPGSDRVLEAALAETETAVQQSLAAAQGGDAEKARLLLERASAPLAAWRRAHGVRLFADCIGEIDAAFARLDGYRAANLDQGGVREGIVSAAAAVQDAVARCDREAPTAMRNEPEFRRLIDGLIDNLRQLPQALDRRDGATLTRLLGEQRAFVRLLAFRFG